MKRYALIYGILAITLCTAWEQKEKPKTQEDAIEKEAPKFNPKNVKTYQGKITQVFTVTDPYSGLNLIGVVVRTNQGEIPMELGPPSFVLNGPVDFEAGKEVNVQGSEQYLDKKIYVLAQEVKVDKYTLKLRDRDGIPLWTGWKK